MFRHVWTCSLSDANHAERQQCKCQGNHQQYQTKTCCFCTYHVVLHLSEMYGIRHITARHVLHLASPLELFGSERFLPEMQREKMSSWGYLVGGH